MRNLAPPSKLVTCLGPEVRKDGLVVVTYEATTTGLVAYMVKAKKAVGWDVYGITCNESFPVGTGLKKAHAVKACSDYCITHPLKP